MIASPYNGSEFAMTNTRHKMLRIERFSYRSPIYFLAAGRQNRLEKERTLNAEKRPLNYTDQIPTFKIFKGLLIVNLNLFFQPPARRGLRGHAYKVLQGAGHRRRRGLAFSERVVKYCNKLPAHSPLCQCFQEKVGEKCD